VAKIAKVVPRAGTITQRIHVRTALVANTRDPLDRPAVNHVRVGNTQAPDGRVALTVPPASTLVVVRAAALIVQRASTAAAGKVLAHHAVPTSTRAKGGAPVQIARTASTLVQVKAAVLGALQGRLATEPGKAAGPVQLASMVQAEPKAATIAAPTSTRANSGAPVKIARTASPLVQVKAAVLGALQGRLAAESGKAAEPVQLASMVQAEPKAATIALLAIFPALAVNRAPSAQLASMKAGIVAKTAPPTLARTAIKPPACATTATTETGLPAPTSAR